MGLAVECLDPENELWKDYWRRYCPVEPQCMLNSNRTQMQAIHRRAIRFDYQEKKSATSRVAMLALPFCHFAI